MCGKIRKRRGNRRRMGGKIRKRRGNMKRMGGKIRKKRGNRRRMCGEIRKRRENRRRMGGAISMRRKIETNKWSKRENGEKDEEVGEIGENRVKKSVRSEQNLEDNMYHGREGQIGAYI